MASRYWVGGTAAWDATAGTKWALTSGGAGGQPAPTSTDDVFFDANSGANTVSIPSSVNCQNLNCTGFTGTLAWTTASSTINTYGSVTFSTGMSTTVAAAQSAIQFFGTTAATVTTNGKTQPSWSFLSANTWTVNDNVTFASGCRLAVVGGSSTSCKVIGLAGSLRQLTFSGSFSAHCISLGYGATSSGYIENFAVVANSVSSTSYNIVNAADSVNRQIKSCSVSVQGTDGLTQALISCTSVCTFTAISYTATGSTSRPCSLVNAGGSNATVGTFTVAPTSGDFAFLADVACTTSITLTGSNRSTGRVMWVEAYAKNPVSGTPTISLTNASFMNLNPTGTTWSGTSLEDLGLNSNITFTTATTRTASASGNWNAEATWGSNPMPLAQDTVAINASVSVTGSRSFGYGITQGAACSAFSMGAGSTFTGTLHWYGRSAKTIPSSVTVSSADFYFPDVLANTNGSYTLSVGSNVKSLNFGLFPSSRGTTSITSSVLTVTVTPDTGTRNLGMVGVYDSPTRVQVSLPASSCTVGRLSCGVWSGQTYASSISCSGTVTINGTDATYDQIIYSANSQSSVSLSSVVLSGNGTKTLWNDGGLSMSSLSVTGTGNLTFTGNTGVTLGSVSRTSTDAETWTFAAGKTYTASAWTAKGQSGALLTLASSSTSAFTLAYSGTGYIGIDYMSISYSAASPANTWFAGANSTNGGNNTGWTFSTYAASQSKGLFFGSNF